MIARKWNGKSEVGEKEKRGFFESARGEKPANTPGRVKRQAFWIFSGGGSERKGIKITSLLTKIKKTDPKSFGKAGGSRSSDSRLL